MLTQDDVIYFVITDRFFDGDPANNQPADPANPKKFHGGDFAGLVQKIPYFKTLGVTAVWLTPVYVNIVDFFDSAGYHGYWAMDFERVDPHLYSARPDLAEGSRAYLADLVREFHDAGLKVILDMVVNHTGYHSPGYDNYPHKYLGYPEHFNTGGMGDEIKGPLAGLPDLNHDLPEVADYFVQNILDWIEQTGIDAIRMDTVKHVEPMFWYLFKSLIRTRHPQVTLLGEALLYDPAEIGKFQQKYDFDTLFDFPMCGVIKGTLVWDHSMTELARPRLTSDEPKGILDRDAPYTNANRLVTLLDNHDLKSRITTEILDRVGGNRDLTKQLLKLCLTFLFTTRGIPQIYYGTEIGLEGGEDPDNRRDMPWDIIAADHRPDPGRTFERDIFDHTVRMIQVRAQNPAIRFGYLFTLYVDHFIYAYLREFQGNLVLVAINNGWQPMPLPLAIEIGGNSNIPPRIKALLPDNQTLTSRILGLPDVTADQGRVHVQLPGKTAGVWTI